jgi:DNA modification methylase
MHGGYLKPKDLCMVPNRIAIALQEAGWWVRSEIIWHKPNPMPESIKDRPGSSHEKIWLLTKSARYFYDADAIAEPVTGSTVDRVSQPNWPDQVGSTRAHAGGKTNGNMKAVVKKQDGHGRRHAGFNERRDAAEDAGIVGLTRNSRNVWTIGTDPFPEAHFATFPAELAERCIKAGSPVGGEVLDPFGGAGTTGLAAASLGRRVTLIELNPEYCTLARARIEAAFMGKDEGARHMTKQLGKEIDAGPLFAKSETL